MQPDLKRALAGSMVALALAPPGADAQEAAVCASEGELEYVYVGLPVGDEIWIGTFSGDRVGILPRQ